jgi:hypothetical protein
MTNGRTAREKWQQSTDHGTGGAMLYAGGVRARADHWRTPLLTVIWATGAICCRRAMVCPRGMGDARVDRAGPFGSEQRSSGLDRTGLVL